MKGNSLKEFLLSARKEYDVVIISGAQCYVERDVVIDGERTIHTINGYKGFNQNNVIFTIYESDSYATVKAGQDIVGEIEEQVSKFFKNYTPYQDLMGNFEVKLLESLYPLLVERASSYPSYLEDYEKLELLESLSANGDIETVIDTKYHDFICKYACLNEVDKIRFMLFNEGVEKLFENLMNAQEDSKLKRLLKTITYLTEAEERLGGVVEISNKVSAHESIQVKLKEFEHKMNIAIFSDYEDYSETYEVIGDTPDEPCGEDIVKAFKELKLSINELFL